MRTTLFTTALALMACPLTDAVPINAATEAEMFGLNKLTTPLQKYCDEKFDQANNAVVAFL